MARALPRRLPVDPDASSSAAPSVSASQGAGSSRDKGGYTNEANFDTNMVIILAALLCALICALGLNSIVRCAIRCSRRFAFETPGGVVARGLPAAKRSALRRIPVVIYGASSALHIVASGDCAICLGELAEGDKVRVLPGCCHGFHVTCIDTWLLSHSSCPTCRNSLLDQADADHHPHPIGPPDASLVIPVDEVG